MDSTKLPTYHTVVREMGIDPQEIYARCDALTRFTFNRMARRVAPPRVGQKPTPTKRKKR